MAEDRSERTEARVQGVQPAPEKVESRAEGRPPEERASDDARKQAEAILEESEGRVADRAAQAEPGE